MSEAGRDPLWYKHAIIYQLHVKSFNDSDGDGYGDFPGLTAKLDYLAELGVTCLWLLPFYPSPLKDDGYDIADYGSINPRYGTMEDFRRFLADSWSGVVFSARELSRRLERCGFRVVETRGAGTQYLRATAIKPG